MKEYQQILQQIRAKQFSPVYLLDGEEPYYIDLLLHTFANDILTEDEKSFNLEEVYAKDIEGADVVISHARRYPMFSDYIIVIVKDASQLKQIDLLEAYLANPSPQTILVIDYRYKTLDKRGKLYKALQKSKATYATFNKIKEHEMPTWIANYGLSLGIQIAPTECEMLSVYLGNDLQKLTNEISKIRINEPDMKQLTAQHIEQYIGISKEYNIIDLPQVLFSGDKNRLARMVAYFSAQPKNAPLVMVIGLMYSFINKLYLCFYSPGGFENDKKLGIWAHHRQIAQRFHMHQVQTFFSILQEYNCKSRGIESAANETALLKEMIGRINSVINQH
jgi:DNA polymerase-3 subunit delta